MLRTTLVLAFFISAVSCDILEEILWMSASEFQANDPDKGYVNNCDPSESTFYMDWYPKVMVKGETVTVEGNYTFHTAVGKRTMTIPRDIPIPAGRKFKVEAELINSNTGDEIGCADAEIEFRDEDDSGYITYSMDSDYSAEDSDYSTEDSDHSTKDSDYRKGGSDYRTGDSDYSTRDSDTSSEVNDLDDDYDLLIDIADALLKK